MKLTIIFVFLAAAVVCSTMALSPPAGCLPVKCPAGEGGPVCIIYTKQYASSCMATAAQCPMGRKGFHALSQTSGHCPS